MRQKYGCQPQILQPALHEILRELTRLEKSEYTPDLTQKLTCALCRGFPEPTSANESMSLRRMATLVAQGRYKTIERFRGDIEAIIANYIRYNPIGSAERKWAAKLRKYYTRLLSETAQSISSTPAPAPPALQHPTTSDAEERPSFKPSDDYLWAKAALSLLHEQEGEADGRQLDATAPAWRSLSLEEVTNASFGHKLSEARKKVRPRPTLSSGKSSGKAAAADCVCTLAAGATLTREPPACWCRRRSCLCKCQHRDRDLSEQALLLAAWRKVARDAEGDWVPLAPTTQSGVYTLEVLFFYCCEFVLAPLDSDAFGPLESNPGASGVAVPGSSSGRRDRARRGGKKPEWARYRLRAPGGVFPRGVRAASCARLFESRCYDWELDARSNSPPSSQLI
jgi:hypothetical protein